MTLYGLGTKSASALGLASIALEAHDMGKRCARRDRKGQEGMGWEGTGS